MKDLDFLPVRYGQRGVQRRARVYRGLALAALLLLVMAATIWQGTVRRSVEVQVRDVRLAYDACVAGNERLGDLQSKLKAARIKAELYTYLRHPWPSTQVLAHVLRPLPGSITLARVEISAGEIVGPVVPLRPAAAAKTTATEPPALMPAAQDLARFREELDPRPLKLILEGESSDSASLHVYLGQLAASELFSGAELQTLQLQEEGDDASFRFTANLTVRPGYAQPGGPELSTRPAKSGALR